MGPLPTNEEQSEMDQLVGQSSRFFKLTNESQEVARNQGLQGHEELEGPKLPL